MLCKVVMSSKNVFVISCFTASMLWSLMLLSPRSVLTQCQLLRNADTLPTVGDLPVQAPPGQNTARQI
jgi:hypothetical protein